MTYGMVGLAEWAGSVCGMLGAGLLSVNTKISRYGWIFFFAANIFVGAFAWAEHHDGLLMQQAVFFITSSVGIWRTFGASGVRVSNGGGQ